METKKATIRLIAAAAGVSSTTVSLALRRHPRISAATTRRIAQLARKHGYRPDPKVAQLMHHLRQRHKPRFQSTIYALTNSGFVTRGPLYQKLIIESARDCAEQLGYGFRLVDTAKDPRELRALGRALHYQGVEGVLLPPGVVTGDFTELMDWQWFSVVAATYGVVAPDFHRVVPHQFGNSLLMCRRLTDLGYRRLGLVLRKSQDIRVHHGFSAAVAWHNEFGGTESVRPLIHEGEWPVDLADWFRRERPDALIVGGPDDAEHVRMNLRGIAPRGLAFALTACLQDRHYAGIDEQPELIGRAAMEMLHAKILNHEKGIPPHPTTTMINGRWNPGTTARPRKAG